MGSELDTKRPQSTLGCQPPAPEALIPLDQKLVVHQLSKRTNQFQLSIDAGFMRRETGNRETVLLKDTLVV